MRRQLKTARSPAAELHGPARLHVPARDAATSCATQTGSARLFPAGLIGRRVSQGLGHTGTRACVAAPHPQPSTGCCRCRRSGRPPPLQEELIRYSERTGAHRLLRLDSFADHTTKETWDLSAWIRVYSTYLDERLSVLRAIKFDPEQVQQPRRAPPACAPLAACCAAAHRPSA